jgi:hypothetical protein
MVGFLTLSPEETEIVLGGGIEEPRYRPFPGSRKDGTKTIIPMMKMRFRLTRPPT